MFKPNREANQIRRDASGSLLLLAQLLVGGGGWVDRQAAGIAHVGEVCK